MLPHVYSSPAHEPGLDCKTDLSLRKHQNINTQELLKFSRPFKISPTHITEFKKKFKKNLMGNAYLCIVFVKQK